MPLPLQYLVSLTVLLILWSLLIAPVAVRAKFFDCQTNATAMSFDIEMLSGRWYEVCHAPLSEVPACVRVIAPDNIRDNNYTLRLKYVNNVNNGWKLVREIVSFPWNDDTKNGVFNLRYGNDNVFIIFTYKLVMTNYNEMAVVCGYASVSRLSFLKIMTRRRRPSQTVKDGILKMARGFGIESMLTWVDQSDMCNGALKLLSPWTIFLAILYQVVKRF